MAQTKRKRQTKHRGNAAGIIESRGRTGRKPTAEEKSGKARGGAQKREDRLDRPPTWRAAFLKAMFAAVALLLVVIFALKNSNQAIALFPIVLVFYTVVSYYSDSWLYKRRMRAKAAAARGKATQQ